MTNGPHWFGYDWIYAYYAIEGARRKGHAAKSYCQISQPIRQRTESYLRAFFDFQLPPDATNLPAVGSSLVPRDETILSLLRRLPEVVIAEIPPTPELLLGNLSILAALAHFTFLLFSGLRNNPMQPLPLRHLNPAADWELIYQKNSPAVMYVPTVTRNILRKVGVQTRRYLDKLRSLGFAVGPCWDFVAYGFPESRQMVQQLRFCLDLTRGLQLVLLQILTLVGSLRCLERPADSGAIQCYERVANSPKPKCELFFHTMKPSSIHWREHG